jgi:hypothetical protein
MSSSIFAESTATNAIVALAISTCKDVDASPSALEAFVVVTCIWVTIHRATCIVVEALPRYYADETELVVAHRAFHVVAGFGQLDVLMTFGALLDTTVRAILGHPGWAAHGSKLHTGVIGLPL